MGKSLLIIEPASVGRIERKLVKNCCSIDDGQAGKLPADDKSTMTKLAGKGT
jgi:hypothetical protein